MAVTGCTFDEGTRNFQRICGKVCDAGKTYCPRHEVVAKVREQDRRKKEDAKIDKLVNRNAKTTVRA